MDDALIDLALDFLEQRGLFMDIVIKGIISHIQKEVMSS